MKREYSVVCFIKLNGNLYLHTVNVIAGSENEAEEYAVKIIKAQGYNDVFAAPKINGAENIKDNGPASIEDINDFDDFCGRLGIKAKYL